MRSFLFLLILFHKFVLLGQLVEQPLEEAPPDAVTKAKILADNVKSQIQGNNQFALELFYRIKNQPGNVIVSPLSVTSSMAMAYAASFGATLTQMQGVFHYLSQNENLYDVFAWINKHFSKSWYEGPNETRLYLVNSLWVQRDIKILPSYSDIISKYFKQNFRQADFMRNPEAARLNINSWMKEKTLGRISDIAQPDQIESSTRMMLPNGDFLKAVWRNAFDPGLTTHGVFFKDPVLTTSASIMTTTGEFSYVQTNPFQAVALPFRSSYKEEPQFSMLILLPRNSYDTRGIENSLSIETFDSIIRSMETKLVLVNLPKFSITSSFNLDNTLQEMGLSLPFSKYADFSSMTTGKEMALSNVLHKTYLSIDEKGTEALAATALSLNLKTSKEAERPILFRADHPFIFIIMDRLTNSILFIGRVMTP